MVWSNLLITLYTWLPLSDFLHLLHTMIIITTIIILIVMIMLIIIVISSSSLGVISTSPRADPPPTSTPSPVPYSLSSRSHRFLHLRLLHQIFFQIIVFFKLRLSCFYHCHVSFCKSVPIIRSMKISL